MGRPFPAFVRLRAAAVLFLCAACAPDFPGRLFRSSTPSPGPEAAPEPLFVVRPVHGTREPFWFELGPGGPVLIPSPGEASLPPLVPWKAARHITGFLPMPAGTDEPDPGVFDNGGDILFAAVNRGGLLGFERRKTAAGAVSAASAETAIYYYRGGRIWEDYPAAAFFRYGEMPAVLFAGDRFFEAGAKPAPDPAVWILAPSAASKPTRFPVVTGGVRSAAVPALEPAGGETVSLFFAGSSGPWYFRRLSPVPADSGANNGDGKTAGKTAGKTTGESVGSGRWFRTADLSRPGTAVDDAEALAAAEPVSAAAGPGEVPPLLAWVLEEAARLEAGPEGLTVTAVSPAFPARRFFRAVPAGGDSGPSGNFGGNSGGGDSGGGAGAEGPEPAAYYRPAGTGTAGPEALAALVFPGGRGVYARSGPAFAEGESGAGGEAGAAIRNGHFRLPDLPEGFVYTGAAVLDGEQLVVSWEEQSRWNVGVSGFLLLEMDW